MRGDRNLRLFARTEMPDFAAAHAAGTHTVETDEGVEPDISPFGW